MSNTNLVIYEGSMCCSSGVCGPEPDIELIEFNETLRKIKLEFRDIEVTRASISFDARIFSENKEVLQIIKDEGQNALPITCINGNIIIKQKYLKFDELKKELEKYL